MCLGDFDVVLLGTIPHHQVVKLFDLSWDLGLLLLMVVFGQLHFLLQYLCGSLVGLIYRISFLDFLPKSSL